MPFRYKLCGWYRWIDHMNFFRTLAHDERGAPAVEFAFAAPVFIMMVFGVMQVGLSMQAKNALQGSLGDVGRYVVMQHASDHGLDDEQIEARLISVATDGPYLLKEENLVIDSSTAVASDIAGTKKITISMNYSVPSILPIISELPWTMSTSRTIYAKTPNN